jgi:ATP-dependent Zn protease
VRAILDRTHDRVHGILTAKKAMLMHAAEELKRTETLEGDRLKRLLAGDGMPDEALKEGAR